MGRGRYSQLMTRWEIHLTNVGTAQHLPTTTAGQTGCVGNPPEGSGLNPLLTQGVQSSPEAAHYRCGVNYFADSSSSSSTVRSWAVKPGRSTVVVVWSTEMSRDQ